MKTCNECGLPMTRGKRLKKGGIRKRGMYRWHCANGHTETVFGESSDREEQIINGNLDYELGIPQIPDAQ